MAIVEKITPNQVKLMNSLFELNREVPRKEVIKQTNLNPTSLQFAIKPLDGFFIKVRKIGNKDLLTLTKAGNIAVKAFNLANNLK